jgi:hypothetical protein
VGVGENRRFPGVTRILAPRRVYEPDTPTVVEGTHVTHLIYRVPKLDRQMVR